VRSVARVAHTTRPSLCGKASAQNGTILWMPFFFFFLLEAVVESSSWSCWLEEDALALLASLLEAVEACGAVPPEAGAEPFCAAPV